MLVRSSNAKSNAFAASGASAPERKQKEGPAEAGPKTINDRDDQLSVIVSKLKRWMVLLKFCTRLFRPVMSTSSTKNRLGAFS